MIAHKGADQKTIDVVVAGHVCLDITPIFKEKERLDLKRIFCPGNLTNMSGVEITAAGCVPNVGISLDILGIKTWLMGKTGCDFFEKAILDFLKSKNMKGSMVEAISENTSYTIVISPPGMDRIFFHDPGANDSFTADDLDYDIIKQARLFHFGYPPLMSRMYENDGCELVKIFKRVKRSGAITSLDMAFTEPSSESGMANWEKILKSVLPFVDLYIPSVEETLYMLERDYYERFNSGEDNLINKLDVNILPKLGDKLLSLGARIAVIKCGVKGYYIRTRQKDSFGEISRQFPLDIENWTNRELLVETYDVKGIKSTTGAGDSSIAGFLAAFLRGKSIEDAAKIAHAVATQSITAYDVFSRIADFETISRMVKEDMPVIRYEMNGSYWKYDSGLGIWRGKEDLN